MGVLNVKDIYAAQSQDEAVITGCQHGGKIQCTHLGQGTLRLGSCWGHSLAIGVGLTEGRARDGGWVANALVKREQEPTGIHYSCKSTSWTVTSLSWPFTVLDVGWGALLQMSSGRERWQWGPGLVFYEESADSKGIWFCWNRAGQRARGRVWRQGENGRWDLKGGLGH